MALVVPPVFTPCVWTVCVGCRYKSDEADLESALAYPLRLAWLVEDQRMLRATAMITAPVEVEDGGSIRVVPPLPLQATFDELTR